jgi:hypothetical protein
LAWTDFGNKGDPIYKRLAGEVNPDAGARISNQQLHVAIGYNGRDGKLAKSDCRHGRQKIPP